MGRDNQYINDEEQPEQLTRLDHVLNQVLETLENGRNNIFDIAQIVMKLKSTCRLKWKKLAANPAGYSGSGSFRKWNATPGCGLWM